MNPHNLNKRRDRVRRPGFCVPWWINFTATGQLHHGRTPPTAQHPFTAAGQVPGGCRASWNHVRCGWGSPAEGENPRSMWEGDQGLDPPDLRLPTAGPRPATPVN